MDAQPKKTDLVGTPGRRSHMVEDMKILVARGRTNFEPIIASAKEEMSTKRGRICYANLRRQCQ